MLLALASVVVAVFAGAALALGGAGPRVIAPLRSFALAAVVATVIADLLPEAVAAGGAPVLLAFAAALVAPGAFARAASWGARAARLADGARPAGRRARAATGGGRTRGRRAVAELAYVSLILHKITDGIALGAAVGPGQVHHWDVVAAVGCHSMPIAATIALAYRATPRVAWLRTLGLAVATIAGAALAAAAAATFLADATPWLDAVAAGLLLHIVTHDLPAARPGAADRAIELVALAAGTALPAVAALLDAGHAPGGGLGAAALDLGRAIAPAVLVGLVAAALLQALAGRRALRWLGAPGPLAGARGATAGAVAPGCSCGAVRTAADLRRRGAPLAAAAALVLAAPALGADTAAVTVILFGAPLAAVRVGAAWLAAAGAALVVAPRRAGQGAPPPGWDLLHGSVWHRVTTALDELVTHAAPWMIAGVVGAALLAGALGPGDLAGAGPAAVAALALAATSYVCAAAAVPVAAALVAAGVPVGAALAGLALAPALHRPTVALLRREAGPARAAAAIAVAAAVAAALWLVAGAVPAASLPAMPRAVGDASLALLGALALRSLWRTGAAAWVAALHGHGAHGGTHDERHGGHGGDPAAPHADHHAPDHLHAHAHAPAHDRADEHEHEHGHDDGRDHGDAHDHDDDAGSAARDRDAG